MSNRFTPIPPGTDPAQVNAMINKNFAEIDNENVKKLFYDENGVPSIIIGIQQDGKSRIKVAKAGYDVTTAADSELAFNSSQNVFKIVQTGTGSFTKPANTVVASTTITHNLGFQPAFVAYWWDTDTTVYYESIPSMSVMQSGAYAGLIANSTSCRADDTVFYVQMDTPNWGAGSNPLYVNAANIGFRYYLLQETAS
jgi:hypothetical protein